MKLAVLYFLYKPLQVWSTKLSLHCYIFNVCYYLYEFCSSIHILHIVSRQECVYAQCNTASTTGGVNLFHCISNSVHYNSGEPGHRLYLVKIVAEVTALCPQMISRPFPPTDFTTILGAPLNSQNDAL